MRNSLGKNVSKSTSNLLYCISNDMRRSILNSFTRHQQLTFSELMNQCGLTPKYDTTGSFNYHLSELIRIGVLSKADGGYRLTRIGRRIHRIVRLLQRHVKGDSLLLFWYSKPRQNRHA